MTSSDSRLAGFPASCVVELVRRRILERSMQYEESFAGTPRRCRGKPSKTPANRRAGGSGKGRKDRVSVGGCRRAVTGSGANPRVGWLVRLQRVKCLRC